LTLEGLPADRGIIYLFEENRDHFHPVAAFPHEAFHDAAKVLSAALARAVLEGTRARALPGAAPPGSCQRGRMPAARGGTPARRLLRRALPFAPRFPGLGRRLPLGHRLVHGTCARRLHPSSRHARERESGDFGAGSQPRFPPAGQVRRLLAAGEGRCRPGDGSVAAFARERGPLASSDARGCRTRIARGIR
jgi:hypothetical protein